MEELAKLELWRQLVVLVPLAVVLVIAAWTDYKERKVFNKLTYPAFFIGLIVHTIAFGPMGFLTALGSAVLAFFLGLFILPFGVIGGGDIKLLVGIGAFLGYKGLAHVAYWAVWFGAGFGLLNAGIRGYLPTMIKRMFRYFRGIFRALIFQELALKEDLETDDQHSWIPFAISILAGGIMAYYEALTGWPGFWDLFLRALGFRA
jgi:prepilin peptidase CpaA